MSEVYQAMELADVDQETTLRDGVALCLSGGGYRAMLFHVGALIRLNQLGVLAGLSRVSSVSGGSITAAKLGREWSRLEFSDDAVAVNLDDRVVEPIWRLAGRSVDVRSGVLGVVVPGRSSSDYVARALADDDLLGTASLADLPDDEQGRGPRFVINATNVQTGRLLRFSRPYVADYTVGMWRFPTTRLADAVAASAAFPPILSPHRIAASGVLDPASRGPNQGSRFDKTWICSDGGVYDNLGLETAWKSYTTVLVSDGGGSLAVDETPARDWVRHGIRVAAIVDGQVRALRKRQLIDAYRSDLSRSGGYWGIRSDIGDYGLADPLSFSAEGPRHPMAVPTRLKALDRTTRRDLLRWGYVICDTALRRWLVPEAPRPAVPDFDY